MLRGRPGDSVRVPERRAVGEDVGRWAWFIDFLKPFHGVLKRLGCEWWIDRGVRMKLKPHHRSNLAGSLAS